MNIKDTRTRIQTAFDKTPKWLINFFYSDLYLFLLSALILASWITGIMLIGFLSVIVFATIILIINDDIKPCIPLLFYVAFCISDSTDLSIYYPYLPCLIPLIGAIVFHLVFYHPKRFSLGQLGISQLCISVALIIGGCTCIVLSRWLGALTYSLLLGIGVFFIYFIWINYLRPTEKIDTTTYLAKVFMWMGLILVGEMLTYYIRYRFNVPFDEWSAAEWIDLGWGIDNNVATLLLLSAPMCLYLSTKKEHPTFYILIAVIQYLCIILTYSRGGVLFGLITAPIVFVFTILKSKNRSESLIITICLVIIALTVFAFIYDKIFALAKGIFESGFESNSRILLYKDALRQFAKHPLFGVGTGYDGPDYMNHVEEIVFYWFHSTFFQIIGSMGLIGIFAYGFSYFMRAKIILKTIKKDTFTLFVFLSLLGFELYSLIDTGTFVPLPTMMIVFILFATLEKHQEDQMNLSDSLMREEYHREIENKESVSTEIQEDTTKLEQSI